METQRELLAQRGIDHDDYDILLEQNQTVDDETTAIKVVRKSDGKTIEAVIGKSRRQMTEDGDTTYIDTIVGLIQELSLAFVYLGAPQRSPEWLAVKRGRIGASRLGDWLSVSKAKTGAGKPLKARLDYEKELMFERKFGVSFETYVNSAMQEGIDYENYAANVYCDLYKCAVEIVGCWYNDFIAVSPDRKIYHQNAGIEIKIVKDNTFTEILTSGVPDKHYKQIQGQLWATGWDYIDYVALNFNTKKVVVIRVEPDTELIDYMKESVQEKLVVTEFEFADKLHDVTREIPEEVVLGAEIDRSDSNTNNGEWK